MSKLKLITEYLEGTTQVITEAVEGSEKKSLFIEGIFMQGNIPNRNKRKYHSDLLEREMNRLIDEKIKPANRSLLGELNHPQRPNVDPKEATHMITEMRRSGDNFYGKAKILTSVPLGQLVEGLINDGVQLGVSTRGLGSLKSLGNGLNEVQDDFHLSTVDIVNDPSGPDCFVNGIMEGAEWIWNSGALTQHTLETAVQVIDKFAQRKEIDEARLLEIFNKLLSEASNS